MGFERGMKSLARRWWFWLLIIIAGAIIIVHVYLALWVRDYVNRKLSEIPGYRARRRGYASSLARRIPNPQYRHQENERKSAGSVFFRAAGRSFRAMARASL